MSEELPLGHDVDVAPRLGGGGVEVLAQAGGDGVRTYARDSAPRSCQPYPGEYVGAGSAPLSAGQGTRA
jgi:hypothetical protein